MYRAVALGNGAQPDAGRRLSAWAREAGFADVTPSASVWLYATPEERRCWGGGWAGRTLESDFARQALDRGLRHRARASRRSRTPGGRGPRRTDGWFAILHGEVLCAPLP